MLLEMISFYSMTFDLELLIRSVSTVKHADTRSMFQLILNNFIMVSRRLSTSTDVSSRFVCLFVPDFFRTPLALQ